MILRYIQKIHIRFLVVMNILMWYMGFLCSSVGKEFACWCRRCGFNPWVGKIPWRRKQQPIPVFLPGKSYGQRSLAGYSPCGHKESDMTEQLNNKNNFTIYEIGQKVHWGFSVIFYGQTQTNFWANPMLYQLTSFEGFQWITGTQQDRLLILFISHFHINGFLYSKKKKAPKVSQEKLKRNTIISQNTFS